MGLDTTPSAERLHIGIFGRTNSGKSTFINAFVGQNISIVSDVAGTTTDPVYKAMEINPIGACVIIDTAGFDDDTMLGKARVEKTRQAADKTDIAVIIFGDSDITYELEWYKRFKDKGTPVLLIVGKADIRDNINATVLKIKESTGQDAKVVSAYNGDGMESIKEELARLIPENYGKNQITANLVQKEDVVLLVMPQDIQAPKNRLILPQVETIRELLDKKCVVISVTADQFENGLKALVKPPKLIITDSQMFGYVYEKKPRESMLTSFSVLFAAYKGDLLYYMEGAKYIDTLNEHSKVLIAECCTHAPLTEDIGRVKIPNMLKKRFGDTLCVDIKSGMDFPMDLTEYDLIIQCGACMFNRKYVLSRVDRAKSQGVPMTNYGVTIAHITGILDKISLPY